MDALHEDKIGKIKNKIKGFFKKIGNKDQINLNRKSNLKDDPNAKHLYRDDLKMY